MLYEMGEQLHHSLTAIRVSQAINCQLLFSPLEKSKNSTVKCRKIIQGNYHRHHYL